MTRSLLLFVIVFCAMKTWAGSIDAVEPSHSCERIFDAELKQNCQKITKRQTMDSYLASVCEKQLEDKSFMECLNLADQMHFDPRKLQKCAADEMEDKTRMECLKITGTPWKVGKPDREPASHKGSGKGHKKKKKKAAHRSSRANQRNSRTPPDQ